MPGYTVHRHVARLAVSNLQTPVVLPRVETKIADVQVKHGGDAAEARPLSDGSARATQLVPLAPCHVLVHQPREQRQERGVAHQMPQERGFSEPPPLEVQHRDQHGVGQQRYVMRTDENVDWEEVSGWCSVSIWVVIGHLSRKGERVTLTRVFGFIRRFSADGVDAGEVEVVTRDWPEPPDLSELAP